MFSLCTSSSNSSFPLLYCAAFYPSITLSGSAGWTNSTGGMISNPAQFLASAVGSLTQVANEVTEIQSIIQLYQALGGGAE